MSQGPFSRFVDVVSRVSTLIACGVFLAAMLSDWVRPEGATPSLAERLIYSGLVGVFGLIALIGAALQLREFKDKWTSGEAELARATGMSHKSLSAQLGCMGVLVLVLVGLSLSQFVTSLNELVAGPAR